MLFLGLVTGLMVQGSLAEVLTGDVLRLLTDAVIPSRGPSKIDYLASHRVLGVPDKHKHNW